MMALSIYITRIKTTKNRSSKISCKIVVGVEECIFLQGCPSFFGVSVTNPMSCLAYKQQKFIAHSSG